MFFYLSGFVPRWGSQPKFGPTGGPFRDVSPKRPNPTSGVDGGRIRGRSLYCKDEFAFARISEWPRRTASSQAFARVLRSLKSLTRKGV